jgi:hypothetical protein
MRVQTKLSFGPFFFLIQGKEQEIAKITSDGAQLKSEHSGD